MSIAGAIQKPRRGNPGEPLKSISGYPYRPAQILPYNLDITQEWAIVFYVWDIGKESLERKRVLKDKLSAIVNKHERIAFAEKMIEEINYFLKRDMHLDTEPAPEIVEFNFRGYTLLEGINYVLKYPENHFIFSNVTRYYITRPRRVEINKEEFKSLSKKERKKRGIEMVIHHQPGEKRVSGNYFYKRLKKHIDRLGFYQTNPNHTLYSFKHTGAISLYMATRDIKLLQRQLRHTTIEQTDTYLRGLGLFEDFEKLNNWSGPF